MLETREKIIGSSRYEVTQLGSSEGRRFFVRLVRIVGPSLQSLLSGVDAKTGSILEASNESVGLALGSIAQALTEEDLEHACKIFGQTTTVHDGDKALPLTLQNQELHFAGKYGQMFEWLAFCLEVNYSDFLGSLKRAAGAVGRSAEKGSST